MAPTALGGLRRCRCEVFVAGGGVDCGVGAAGESGVAGGLGGIILGHVLEAFVSAEVVSEQALFLRR